MDKINKFLAYNGRINVICCDTTTLVEEARKIHDLSPVVTAALGRLLTVTSLMATDLKNKEDKLTIQIKANGPIESMVTVANSNNEIKGYAKNTVVDIPLNEDGKLDVGGAVGFDGFINVIKDIEQKKKNNYFTTTPKDEIIKKIENYIKNRDYLSAELYMEQIIEARPVELTQEEVKLYIMKLYIDYKASNDDELIEKFDIGYAGLDNALFHAFKNLSYKEVDMLRSGLVIEGEHGLFDRYRDRVMFALHDKDGRVIGFSGRIYKDKSNESKYMNSPESDIFIKSKRFYKFSKICTKSRIFTISYYGKI